MFKKAYFFVNKCNTIFLILLTTTGLWAQIGFDGPAESIDTLNSSFDENYLFISYDGSTMVYSRLKSPVNRGGVTNPASMWSASSDDQWRSVQELRFGDSTMASVGFGMVRNNLVYGEVSQRYNSFTSRIFLAPIDGGGQPTEINIPYFSNKSEFLSGYISPDGNVLLMSIEGRTTYGVEDIYVSLRKSSGVWGFPKNLGYTINTAFQEFTPFVSSDLNTLYWASNGRDGEGSFDIYSSQRLDDTWQNWTEPVNLGSAVNTQGAETSFQLAGDYGYYVSTQNSDGYGDIRKIKLKEPEELPELDSIAPPQMNVDWLSREFHVFDAETGEKVVADLHFDGPELDTTFAGVSSVILPRRELLDLTLTVESVGYLTLERFFTGTELLANTLFRLEIAPLAVGSTVQLKNVLFQRGTVQFIGGSELELDRVVEMMENNPSIRIMVKGHTDNVGDPTKNLQLSRQRAKTVRDYIVEKGISTRRVQSQGYGGNDPIASNASEETRKLNRRVEFTVIEK